MLKRDLKRETARLRSILERTLLLVSATTGAATGVGACSTSGAAGTARDGEAPTDATAPDTGVSSAPDAGDSPEASPYPPGCEPALPVEYDASADAPNCEYRVAFPCGLPSFVTSIYPPNCAMPLSTCLEICTGAAFPFLDCQVSNGFGCDYDAEAFVAPDGSPIVVQCDKCTIVGRRPAGLARSRPRAGSALGAFFARAAHLEAASVLAFEILGEELVALGAPPELVRATWRSARDEVRHARVTTRIARRLGAEPAVVRVAPRPWRSPSAIAIENAVEGCVRETFGAAVAAWQARHAQDKAIARAMICIAADETRHAALAWAVAGWLERRLDAPVRSAVSAARRRAVQTLLREAAAPVDASLVAYAGLPTAAHATRMVEELRKALW